MAFKLAFMTFILSDFTKFILVHSKWTLPSTKMHSLSFSNFSLRFCQIWTQWLGFSLSYRPFSSAQLGSCNFRASSGLKNPARILKRQLVSWKIVKTRSISMILYSNDHYSYFWYWFDIGENLKDLSYWLKTLKKTWNL